MVNVNSELIAQVRTLDCSLNKNKQGMVEIAQLVEGLPRMHEALGSISNPT